MLPEVYIYASSLAKSLYSTSTCMLGTDHQDLMSASVNFDLPDERLDKLCKLLEEVTSHFV